MMKGMVIILQFKVLNTGTFFDLVPFLPNWDSSEYQHMVDSASHTNTWCTSVENLPKQDGRMVQYHSYPPILAIFEFWKLASADSLGIRIPTCTSATAINTPVQRLIARMHKQHTKIMQKQQFYSIPGDRYAHSVPIGS